MRMHRSLRICEGFPVACRASDRDARPRARNQRHCHRPARSMNGARDHFAVRSFFQTEPIDHHIQQSERQRQAVVVPELGIADWITTAPSSGNMCMRTRSRRVRSAFQLSSGSAVVDRRAEFGDQ